MREFNIEKPYTKNEIGRHAKSADFNHNAFDMSLVIIVLGFYSLIVHQNFLFNHYVAVFYIVTVGLLVLLAYFGARKSRFENMDLFRGIRELKAIKASSEHASNYITKVGAMGREITYYEYNCILNLVEEESFTNDLGEVYR